MLKPRTSELYYLPKKKTMNSESYVEQLQEKVKHMHHFTIFMHDGVSSPKVKGCSEFLNRINFTTMDLSANSTVLNQFGIFWDIVKSKDLGKQSSNFREDIKSSEVMKCWLNTVTTFFSAYHTKSKHQSEAKEVMKNINRWTISFKMSKEHPHVQISK